MNLATVANRATAFIDVAAVGEIGRGRDKISSARGKQSNLGPAELHDLHVPNASESPLEASA